MNILDIILLLLLLVGAVSGYIKGLFIELASVISIILGIWAGIKFTPTVQIWLSRFLDWSPGNTKLISFIIIFLAVVIIVHLIAGIFESAIKALSLGILSRIGGALIGSLKTAFFMSVLILLVVNIESFTTTIIPDKAKKGSKLFRPIEDFAPNILPFLRSYQKNENDKPENPVII